jgi:hypothetical protein
MAEEEDFLTRWSRRKREAAKTSDPVEQPEHEQLKRSEPVPAKASTDTPAPAAETGRDPTQAGSEAPGVEFDLSKLPSLDSIGPDTDIRVFMQPGVPASLSRAALRRAWAADPAVRDFIGLAENSWDFTAADGVPGFGSLDPADAKRLLAQVFNIAGTQEQSETAAEHAEPSDQKSPRDDASVADFDTADASSTVSGDDVANPGDATHANSAAIETQDAAVQNSEDREPVQIPLRRGHGRALPQ